MTNPEQDDPLVKLWQQQPTVDIDPAKVKKAFLQMLWKQRLYVVLDFASVFFAVTLIVLFKDELSTFVFSVAMVVLFVAVSSACYLLYLRRFVLFSQSQSTIDYLNTLKQQTKSNIRIAKITHHSCWISFVLIALSWGLIGFFDDLPSDEWMRKALISIGLGAVLCSIMWVWAKKRETKFKRELQQLEQQGNQKDA